jgi:hypothetical protein
MGSRSSNPKFKGAEKRDLAKAANCDASPPCLAIASCEGILLVADDAILGRLQVIAAGRGLRSKIRRNESRGSELLKMRKGRRGEVRDGR